MADQWASWFRPADGPEAKRILRVMSRFVGGGFLVFSIQAFLGFGRSGELVAAWFNPVATVMVFGPAAALFVLSFTERYRAIKWMALATAVGYLVACALWLVAWTGHTDDSAMGVWLRLMSGIPPLAMVLIRPLPTVIFWLALTATFSALLVNLTQDGRITILLLQSGLWGICFSVAYAITGGKVMNAGKELDDSLDTAVDAAASSAAATARVGERARFDALVHDRVIASLIAANRQEDPAVLAVQAQSALDELDRLASGLPAQETVTVGEFVARLRSVVNLADPSMNVDVSGMAPPDTCYPSTAGEAIAEAVGEAVRNSVRHAGTEVRRAVALDTGADSIDVLVADDGVGFDPSKVPGERLGIAVSIKRRMADLAGGEAIVQSAPSMGTVIRLRWEQ